MSCAACVRHVEKAIVERVPGVRWAKVGREGGKEGGREGGRKEGRKGERVECSIRVQGAREGVG
jgi:copper chaperone CopZ